MPAHSSTRGGTDHHARGVVATARVQRAAIISNSPSLPYSGDERAAVGRAIIVAKGQCIRVTPALFTDEADLDRLVEALAVITGTKTGGGWRR